MAEGLIHLQLGNWNKKALIIVSDGGDNASQQKYSQVLALAQRSQVVIYSVGLVDADEDEENPDVLRRLSKRYRRRRLLSDVLGKRHGHLETNRAAIFANSTRSDSFRRKQTLKIPFEK